MKKFMQEFKDFAMRGNVMDMAVGVVIGATFKGIVDSLVNDLLNPLLGLFGSRDLSGYELVLGGAVFRVGAFLTAVINFIIMALVVFLIGKGMNRLHTLTSPRRMKRLRPPPPRYVHTARVRSRLTPHAVRTAHQSSPNTSEAPGGRKPAKAIKRATVRRCKCFRAVALFINGNICSNQGDYDT